MCDRCSSTDECKTGVFGFSKLCVYCYSLLLYGRTNNDDPLESQPENTKPLTAFEQ